MASLRPDGQPQLDLRRLITDSIRNDGLDERGTQAAEGAQFASVFFGIATRRRLVVREGGADARKADAC
jgi:hypothetical protein